MLLVIDVGNTQIVVGVFNGAELLSHWRLGTDPKKTEDEYGLVLANLLRQKSISSSEIKAGIVRNLDRITPFGGNQPDILRANIGYFGSVE